MQFKKSTLFVALTIAMGASSVAMAQANGPVVPPPAPLKAATAPESAASVVVQPPAGVSAVNPASAQQAAPVQAATAAEPSVKSTTPALIDIALPDAPKPAPAVELKKDSCGDKASKCELRPAAPGKRPVTKTAAAPAEKKAEPKVPVDPFAGIIGTPVSDSQLNRFVFQEPVSGIYFQEGSPLPECPKDAAEQDPCKPVFLNGKRVVLLQLRAGAKGPFQMVTHLESGRFVTMNLMPAQGPGAVVRVDGAEDGASDARLAASKASAEGSGGESMASSEKNVALLSRFAKGDIPAGFEAVKVSGAPVRFQHFDVVQQASWDNGANLRAHLYQVFARGTTPVLINASLFRNENVRALALDRETITDKQPAMLYMLEFVPTEQH